VQVSKNSPASSDRRRIGGEVKVFMEEYRFCEVCKSSQPANQNYNGPV